MWWSVGLELEAHFEWIYLLNYELIYDNVTDQKKIERRKCFYLHGWLLNFWICRIFISWRDTIKSAFIKENLHYFNTHILSQILEFCFDYCYYSYKMNEIHYYDFILFYFLDLICFSHYSLKYYHRLILFLFCLMFFNFFIIFEFNFLFSNFMNSMVSLGKRLAWGWLIWIWEIENNEEQKKNRNFWIT